MTNPPPAETAPPASLPSARTAPWPLQATLLAASSLTVMAGATIAPALPAMRAHFAAVDDAEFWVKLVLTVPALAIALAAPLVGVVRDRWRRTSVLLAAVVLYGLAGSAGAVLDTLPGILVSRALLGVAVAGVMTSVTTLVADYFAGAARARFMARQAALMGLGGVVFLTAGGALADRTWRGPFFVYLAAFALLPALRRLTAPQALGTRAGAPAASGRATVPAAGAVADPDPRNGVVRRVVTTALGAALVAQIGFYTIPTQLPFYLSRLDGASATRSGVAIAGSTLFAAAAALLYPRLASRLSPSATLAVSFGLLGAGLATLGAVTTYPAVLGALAISGAGTGLIMPTLSVWLADRVPSARRGRVLGGLTSALFAGQFLSPLVVQPISAAVGLASAFVALGMGLGVVAVTLALARRSLRGASASALVAPSAMPAAAATGS